MLRDDLEGWDGEGGRETPEGGDKYIYIYIYIYGFSGSSAGKESVCNAGDSSLILGSGRVPGEGIGYPF